MTADDTLGSMLSLLEAVADTPSPAVAIAPGTVIGDRFRIIGRLGMGGMGVVYRAHDARLQRDVALKLTLYSKGEEALREEAIAMAQLSHPNVVAAYEVDEFDAGVAIVMELVEGQTARAWNAARPRPWREIRDVFCAAGAGLAAIHAAGLVHRDFKADNVLVGGDGRVRIADLGLASGSLDARASPANPVAARRGGTPGYMAPEVIAGEPATAASDQYSFCVALREALLRARPPARLGAALARGLAARPAERWPSMGALLAKLERDPWRARRAGLLAAGAASALALSVLLTARVASRGPLCAGGASSLTGVWDPPTKAAVRESFIAGGRAFAADTFARVERILDAYAAEWAKMYQEACRATAVRHEQSEAALDVRMACLGRRLTALRELTTALGGAGAVDQAVSAAAALEPIAGCADVPALAAAYPPPDQARAASVAAVTAQIERATALRRLGRYGEALGAAQAAVADARATGYPPAAAAALLALGNNQMHVSRELRAAEATLREAIAGAAAARDDVLAARAWVGLLGALTQDRREDEALAQRTAAEAALIRAGDPDAIRALLESTLGLALRRRDRLEEAAPHLARAVELFERAGDRDRLSAALQALGNVRREQGAFEEARALQRRALALAEEVLGPQHPQVAIALYNLAMVTAPEEAVALAARALQIAEPAYGADSAEVARVLAAQAETLLRLGRCDEGVALAERSLAIKRRRLPADHPDVANGLVIDGNLRVCAGDLAAGRRAIGEALAMLEKRPGHERTYALIALARAEARAGRLADAEAAARRALAAAPGNAAAEHALGLALLLRDPAQALTHLSPAVAGYERLAGTGSNLVAEALVDEAAALRALQRPSEALPLIERALAIRAPGEPRRRGAVRFALAQTLWDLGQRDRAHRAAEEARAELATGGSRSDAQAVISWLRGRGRR